MLPPGSRCFQRTGPPRPAAVVAGATTHNAGNGPSIHWSHAALPRLTRHRFGAGGSSGRTPMLASRHCQRSSSIWIRRRARQIRSRPSPNAGGCPWTTRSSAGREAAAGTFTFFPHQGGARSGPAKTDLAAAATCSLVPRRTSSRRRASTTHLDAIRGSMARPLMTCRCRPSPR